MMHLKTKDYLFVGIQFLLFLLFIIDFAWIKLLLPNIIKIVAAIIALSGLVVLLLAILQLNRNLSPFPSPKSNSELVQTGLYKFIRHPIYTGILLSFFGYAFFTESFFRVLITIFLYILFLYKLKYEEKMLADRFENYSNYKKKTGRFFPKLF
ncbi:methyltransferase family protein [Christiangramia echinicola]|nr:isoprenylcysteine carboxylmethyltransferase family protein [Christiangramia echinicola]